jgi:hypothetical protein
MREDIAGCVFTASCCPQNRSNHAERQRDGGCGATKIGHIGRGGMGLAKLRARREDVLQQRSKGSNRFHPRYSLAITRS